MREQRTASATGPTYYRSPFVLHDPEDPGHFSLQDHINARCIEVLLDHASDQDHTPSTQVPVSQTQAEQAAQKLGMPITEDTKKALLKVANAASIFSSHVEAKGHSVMSRPERATYHPEYGVNQHVEHTHPMKPFFNHAKYLASRFIIQGTRQLTEEYGSRSTDELRFCAIGLAERIFTTLEPTINSLFEDELPAYTKVLAYFDYLSLQNKNHTEVFLGRDGIGAYFARIGMLAARGDISTDRAGAVNPVYMVYNREIAKSHQTKDKQRYINQHIPPSTNYDSLHFFDTGSRGSIPSEIIDILGAGISRREKHKKIHMLNSTLGKRRRAPWLPKNMCVQRIENLPKTERTTPGLTEQDGVMKYIRIPSSPEEQFQALIYRSVIMRHFWIEERRRLAQELGRPIVDRAESRRLGIRK